MSYEGFHREGGEGDRPERTGETKLIFECLLVVCVHIPCLWLCKRDIF